MYQSRHAWPAVQIAPGASTVEQAPVCVLQVPARWQASAGGQLTAVPPQTPLVHLSPVVQALPSLHVLPLVFVDGPHVPVDPHAWHCVEHDVTLQQTPSVHMPESHCVPIVHAWPAVSLHPPGLRQTWLLLQTVPQLTQLVLVVRLTQLPLQHPWPAVQQVPLQATWPV